MDRLAGVRAGFWWWGPAASGPQPVVSRRGPELATWAWSTATRWICPIFSVSFSTARPISDGGRWPRLQSSGRLNPLCRVQAIDLRLNQANVREVFQGFELVLDASDNFPTRFLVSECCWQGGIPLVSAAATGWHGQLLVVRRGGESLLSLSGSGGATGRRPCPPPLKWAFWARVAGETMGCLQAVEP